MNRKVIYYFFSVLISTFNGVYIKNILGYKIQGSDFLEYILRALIFGYLLTAIVYAGIFVSSSLICKEYEVESKRNDHRAVLHSSIISFCIILFFHFIKQQFKEY